jgi:hypothetical protein
VSYKSVSEISEYEEFDAEPSEFVVNTKKKKSQLSKLNESIHSVTSNFSKEIFEEKEEEGESSQGDKDKDKDKDKKSNNTQTLFKDNNSNSNSNK